MEEGEKMKKKAIFLDIDGTLCMPGKSVSKRVVEALQEARNNGHYVFLCTGRNRSGVESLMSIGFDGVICSAGGYIEVQGQKIYEIFLKHEDVTEAREVFERNHIMYNLEATDRTYQDDEMNRVFVEGETDTDKSNSEFLRLLQEHKDNFNIHSIQEFDENPLPIHKICFIARNKEDLNEPMDLLSHKYRWIVHDLFSNNKINGEIILNGIDKGHAIYRVVDYLHLSMEDTIGFGDSLNDLEMIQACQHGVVMGNGSKELKQYATSICESVQDDGIYHELKRLHIIG